ncbi:DUF3810 domain-containing protein [Oceanirhabdus sp. W0125-5]|uniref:DUF3810 domain-containing protein n=1 Tax=Oceanirhabdus sp. W0125-5 TaxID=2999116 RepID=UPI0022F2A958|nr:DUF3810 domain-containing protein [Oceanirhabdus sp. W0125-5]WBW97061.1 DUF3810 domain-containing protein [Oceanirhabdus sp. W0125-5]
MKNLNLENKTIGMKKIDLRFFLIGLFPIAMILKYICSLNPQLTEEIYSIKFNKVTREILSKITNIIPFSLYEVFILVIVLGTTVYIVYTVINMIRKRKYRFKLLLSFILNVATVFSVLYFLFIVLWGLNYNRISFGETIGIEKREYTQSELVKLHEHTVYELNRLRKEVEVDENNVMTASGGYKDIFKRAELGYKLASQNYPTLGGDYGSPKHFITEFIGHMVGGIYWPYTGQPAINTNMPYTWMPFTSMHEMAHQRGYAQEDEANFIAYILCIKHPDADFQYSGNMLALRFTSRVLKKENPDLLNKLNEKLSDDVKRDLQYKTDYWNKHESLLSKIGDWVNDLHLKSNGVKDGTKSYNRALYWIIAYNNFDK